MAETWTVRSLLAWAREWLANKGVDSPRLDAELLLAHALGCSRTRLYVDFDKPQTGHVAAQTGNGNGNGHHVAGPVAAKSATAEKIRQARLKGYEGDPCSECGQLTLVRSGVCCKCDSCGATSGCS